MQKNLHEIAQFFYFKIHMHLSGYDIFNSKQQRKDEEREMKTRPNL